jgi:Glycine cleavage system T protein (aminomethyltransferase)
LFDLHHREGAKFVEFAGWELPLHFGSILEEAKAVRSSCGMFDVSHMGRIGVQACKRVSVNVVASAQANGVAEKLDWLVTMDVRNMAIGQVRYGFLCNERGAESLMT